MSTTTMMRCVTVINFKQLAQTLPIPLLRSLEFSFEFVNEFSCEDSWADLTNSAKIVFPKNIYVKTKEGHLFPLGGNTESKQLNSLFQRGDSVTINYGYYTYENGREFLDLPKEPVFSGFISKVSSKKPIVLECEDNMWQLKQIQCNVKTWPKGKTVEDLMRQLLTGTDFTVNATTKTTVGNLVIQNETVAQLIMRLRKEFHLEAYFRGNELRIGSQIYIESEANTHNFEFQKNIISDELEFYRKDDIKLSAICNSRLTVKTGKKNKEGEEKTKKETLQVLVFSDAVGNFKHIKKEKDVDFPANDEGERRTFFFDNLTNADDLAQAGINELKKYYYTGLKGKFTTFAIPFVKMGDNVNITDNLMPDRNGLYKVRSVKYSGGVKGHRQIIELDFRIQLQGTD